jgi:enoyl-CoA hydratase/carnithine racemase
VSEPLRASAPDEGVLLLELDRGERHNALDLAAVEQLQQQLAGIDASVRAVVLASTTPGRFCAGADLDVPDAERAQVSDALYVLLEQMLTTPVPIIAAADGPAVGGGAQLCQGCDVRLGSSRARFRFVGLGHGLAVGTWALPATTNRRGMELLLSQRFLDAQQAAEIGVLDRVVADPRAEALQLAQTTATLEPDAVRRAKQQLVRGHGLLQRLAEERAGNGAVFTGSVPRQ